MTFASQPPGSSPLPPPSRDRWFASKDLRPHTEVGPDPFSWSTWFPLAKYWRTLLTGYVLFTAFLLSGNLTANHSQSLWVKLSALTIPITHLGSFGFIAPIPWILTRRLRSPWNYVLGFILSLIVCEFTSALLPVIDVWIRSHGRLTFNLRGIMEEYLTMVAPGMMIVGGLAAARATSEERRLASEAEAFIAKNRLLQSQVHPHVLFNALNGLAELVHKSPVDAETAIRHLSDLLRRIMQASEHAQLPLKEEHQIISDFLALESIRLGKRLRITWEWDHALDKVELPPLLLQPLVENAIKHGVALSISGGEVRIRAALADGTICLDVWNSGAPYVDMGRPGGLGIKNLRSRLNLQFDSGAVLKIEGTEDGTLASIRIEAKQVECSNESPESLGR